MSFKLLRIVYLKCVVFMYFVGMIDEVGCVVVYCSVNNVSVVNMEYVVVDIL